MGVLFDMYAACRVGALSAGDNAALYSVVALGLGIAVAQFKDRLFFDKEYFAVAYRIGIFKFATNVVPVEVDNYVRFFFYGQKLVFFPVCSHSHYDLVACGNILPYYCPTFRNRARVNRTVQMISAIHFHHGSGGNILTFYRACRWLSKRRKEQA